MKPFELELALAGDPVVTRQGKKIIEIHYFKNRRERPVLYLVEPNNQYLFGATKEGKNGHHEDHDLFMAPKTKKYYINIFGDRTRSPVIDCSSPLLENEYKQYITPTHIKTIEFEREE